MAGAWKTSGWIDKPGRSSSTRRHGEHGDVSSPGPSLTPLPRHSRESGIQGPQTLAGAISGLPLSRRAVRGTDCGCDATILYNEGVSPWPGLARRSTSSLRTSWSCQDVDARDKPGQGAFGGKIQRRHTFERIALQFSPESAALSRGDGNALKSDPETFLVGPQAYVFSPCPPCLHVLNAGFRTSSAEPLTTELEHIGRLVAAGALAIKSTGHRDDIGRGDADYFELTVR
jgi:hypothetical protein